MTGIETGDLTRSNLIDDLVGNWQGSTRAISIERLVALIASLMGPSYVTRAQLYADLGWPSGSIGYVRSDSTTAYNGVYKKTGAAGAGGWTRIGDLPSGAVEVAQINALQDLVQDLAQWGDTLSLTSVTGTANAAIAEKRAAQADLLANNETLVTVQWPITNTAADPTLTIGSTTLTVRRFSAGAVEPGELVGGRRYLMMRAGTQLRLIGAPGISDVFGLTARLGGLEADAAALADHADDLAQWGDTLSLTNVSGTANVAIAEKRPDQEDLLVNNETLLTVQWPITNTAADPTLTIGSTTLTVRRFGAGAVEPGELVGGRRYLMMRAGTQLRLIGAPGISDVFGLATAIASSVARSQWGDTLSLVNVTGTGDASIAEKRADQAVLSLNDETLLTVRWPATNTAPDPTLTIGGTTLTIRRAGAGAVEPGELVGGRRYLMMRAGTHLRLIGAPAISDVFGLATRLDSEASHRINGLRAAGILPLVGIAGTPDAITANLATLVAESGVGIGQTSTVELIPAAPNTGPATLHVSGDAVREIRTELGAPLGAGMLRSGVSYFLRRRGESWRILSGRVLGDDLAAETGARIAADAAEADARTAALNAINTQLDAPIETAPDAGVEWLGFDRQDHALWGWSASGLRVVLDDVTLGNAAPRILEVPGLAVGVETDEGAEMRAIELDRAGQALRVMRPDGQDMIMSQAFWDRGRDALSIADAGLSTSEWQAITINGQSLSVGGNWSGSETIRDAFMEMVNPAYALMLLGTVRGDDVPITTVEMPRGQGYNPAVPATGVGPANPSTAVVSAAPPLAYAVNAYRADLGLPQVPILTQCHGIAGVAIEDIDDDPLTGSGATTVWQNMVFWYQQAVIQAAGAGRRLTVPWHDWVHGTSAQSYPAGQYEAALWGYQRDMRAMLASLGAEGPALFITSQPAGNANTSHVSSHWHVCDEILRFCEAGGGVMATPEYAYQIADNNVHPDAHWTIQFQEVKARAIAEVEAGRPWTIHRPRAEVTDTRVVLDFDSLRPGEYLVRHDAARYGGEGIDAYAGFEAVGAAITAMQVQGRQVVLDCDAPPTAVRYAMQSQDVSGFAGNMWTAHRGLLRTSDVWPSKLLAGVDLYRWIPSFTLTLE